MMSGSLAVPDGCQDKVSKTYLPFLANGSDLQRGKS